MHREKWKALRKELDASHEANEDLRSKLCTCNKELQETLENQELKASAQLYATSLESESYNAELKELQGTISAIMSEREVERQEHKCKVKELSMRASCWEDEILKLTKRLDDKNAELAEGRDNFSHVSSLLNAKTEQLNVMSAELRQFSAQLLEVSKELEETKAALAESKAEVERSKAQMAKYAVDAEMAQAEVQKSNRMLARRTEELDKKSSLAWRQVCRYHMFEHDMMLYYLLFKIMHTNGLQMMRTNEAMRHRSDTKDKQEMALEKCENEFKRTRQELDQLKSLKSMERICQLEAELSACKAELALSRKLSEHVHVRVPDAVVDLRPPTRSSLVGTPAAASAAAAAAAAAAATASAVSSTSSSPVKREATPMSNRAPTPQRVESADTTSESLFSLNSFTSSSPIKREGTPSKREGTLNGNRVPTPQRVESPDTTISSGLLQLHRLPYMVKRSWGTEGDASSSDLRTESTGSCSDTCDSTGLTASSLPSSTRGPYREVVAPVTRNSGITAGTGNDEDMPNPSSLHDQVESTDSGGRGAGNGGDSAEKVKAAYKPARGSAGLADSVLALNSEDVPRRSAAAGSESRFLVAPLALEALSSARYQVRGSWRKDRRRGIKGTETKMHACVWKGHIHGLFGSVHANTS